MKTIVRTMMAAVVAMAAWLRADGYVLRQATSADGLSNSAVIALHQCADGLLWIGTCDGVNISDGNSIYSLSTVVPGLDLSGIVVENFAEDAEGNVWLQTNHGISRVNSLTGRHDGFADFLSKCKLRCDQAGKHIYLMSDKSAIYRFAETPKPRFVELGSVDEDLLSTLEMVIDGDRLILYTFSGTYQYSIDSNGRISDKTVLSTKPLTFAVNNGNGVITVDNDCYVSIGTPGKAEPRRLVDIGREIMTHGDISDVLVDRRGDIYVSFRTDGVVKAVADGRGGYTIEHLNIRVGVFCLEQSHTQDVVWIGSDCQGVYTHTNGPYFIASFNFHDIANLISHPVRALWLDEQNTLWVGTKGDGVLRIKKFDKHRTPTTDDMQLLTDTNSGLTSNSVFAFSNSTRYPGVLWIAAESDLCYYSYHDRQIHVATDIEPIQSAYALYEDAASGELWIATVGNGVVRARLSGTAQAPELTDVRRYMLDAPGPSNFFFTLATDPQGGMLFGNRGYGVYRIDGDELRPVPLTGDYGTPAVNDVFALFKDNDALWVGTGYGLVRMGNDGSERLYHGLADGFVNNTIHAMLRDGDGDLWLSTNHGLLKFMIESTPKSGCSRGGLKSGVGSRNEFGRGGGMGWMLRVVEVAPSRGVGGGQMGLLVAAGPKIGVLCRL